RKRLKSQDLNFEKTIFRKASKPVEYSPEHLKMQKVLFESLSRKYGKRNVSLEEDWVDIKVETDTCIILFEIKSSLNPKTVIREAFGQIMEYAYHPERIYNKKVQLVIVGRSPLGLHESRYIAFLRDQFRIPLYYQDISI
ncbi:MAG: hypothetical protein KJT03_20295, partial [Verrucomicrobiae bacterium]|nr:hypothetical protein [Verrucomicrobiae bacterium]